METMFYWFMILSMITVVITLLHNINDNHVNNSNNNNNDNHNNNNNNNNNNNDNNFFTSRSFIINYEKNTFMKDGKLFRYISGEMHYFRVPRIHWRDRLQKIRKAGLNTVQTWDNLLKKNNVSTVWFYISYMYHIYSVSGKASDSSHKCLKHTLHKYFLITFCSVMKHCST